MIEAVRDSEEKSGARIGDEALKNCGFLALDLSFRDLSVELPTGLGCEWDTTSRVPDAPGLYVFTLGRGDDTRVVYAGRTSHLWMVTMGRLPRSGGGRGGQRYGRPRHAGETRKRINIEIRPHVTAGETVRHWVMPMSNYLLNSQEERFILQWDLRGKGWNRR